MSARKPGDRPTVAQLAREIERIKTHRTALSALRGTVWTLLVVSAAAVLCSTFLFSVLLVHGSSMAPALQEGQLVIALHSQDFRTGDIIAFYYNNKILLKRVIGSPGDWVDIDAQGTVTVNGQELSEPYVSEKALGQSDLTYPYQVPESRWFVLGDHRLVSADSRSSAIGLVSQEQVLGRVVLRIWPLADWSTVPTKGGKEDRTP